MTEWDVPQAFRTQWENEHDEEYYPSAYDDVDLTPGDLSYKNPYGIDVNNFLHWAYSQLGYHEKDEDSNLSDIGDAGDNLNQMEELYGSDYTVYSGFESFTVYEYAKTVIISRFT